MSLSKASPLIQSLKKLAKQLAAAKGIHLGQALDVSLKIMILLIGR